jgi:hypothetical protein
MVIAAITLTPKKSQKPRSAIRVAPLRHCSCRKNMMISALYQISKTRKYSAPTAWVAK